MAEQKTRQQNLNAAYGAASNTLRQRHKEEFEELYVEEAAKRGETYEPKKTPEQKAEEEMQRLMREYPHLREKVAGEAGFVPDGGAPPA